MRSLFEEVLVFAGIISISTVVICALIMAYEYSFFFGNVIMSMVMISLTILLYALYEQVMEEKERVRRKQKLKTK